MYLIQLFDENCASCTSGVTRVFADDIEEFAKQYRAESTDAFKGVSLETFVWHIAEVFDSEDDLKADMETTWPTDLQIEMALQDLPGEAG